MKTNMNLMKSLMKMSQEQLHKVLYKYLTKYYDNIIIRDNFIIAIGDLSIGLVAHLDTVHKTLPCSFFYDQEQKVLWSPNGLGADDRAGIYGIIQIVEAGYRPHIILCKDEEKGGIGAGSVVQMFPEYPFDNLKCLIELDREGKKDCVFYECDNDDFVKYIEKFGFKTNFGSFSDISILAPQWGVAAVNLSIGYYKEHTLAEFLSLTDMEKTIEKVKSILDSEKEMLNYGYIPAIYSNYKDSNCIFCEKFIKKNEGFCWYDYNLYHICCKECFKVLFKRWYV